GSRVWSCVGGLGGSLVDVQDPDTASFLVPADAVATIQSIPNLQSVAEPPTSNSGPGSAKPINKEGGWLYNVAHTIGADAYWNLGCTGTGVDVAVIDSGVAPLTNYFGSRLTH